MKRSLVQALPGGRFENVSPVRSRIMRAIRGRGNRRAIGEETLRWIGSFGRAASGSCDCGNTNCTEKGQGFCQRFVDTSLLSGSALGLCVRPGG
jgi:hypothetical protein